MAGRKAFEMNARIQRIILIASVAIMLLAALTGLVYALIEREFGERSLQALATGIGALLIAATALLLERLNRRFHPESRLFLWSDVDQLRAVARSATDEETRAWALSLSERIAVVLPRRIASGG
jgi:Na+/melibiose symporter-like transporter